MIGRTISHYRVTSKLGSGGMGVVSRNDPDLESLRDTPEFEQLYPLSSA